MYALGVPLNLGRIEKLSDTNRRPCISSLNDQIPGYLHAVLEGISQEKVSINSQLEYIW
jgi:hypothetical protein